MNKLKTDGTGGMPFETDDIRWEQDAIRDALKGILDSFKPSGASGLILNGCGISTLTSSYQCEAGYVYFNNEIFRVDQHSVAFGASGCHYVFEVESTFDVSGYDTFKDGTLNQTYEIRKAKLVVNTDVSFNASNFTQYDSITLKDVIYEHIVAKDGSWNSITLASGFSNHSVSPGSSCDYKKDAFNTVFLRGIVTSTTVSVGNIFQLPANHRPNSVIYLEGSCMGGYYVITILPSGWVYLVSCDSMGGYVYINLNNINFKIN